MDRLQHAVKLTGFNFESMDTPFLVGALATFAAWYEAEKHLKALGKDSICTSIRSDGHKLMRLAIEPYLFDDEEP